MTPQKAISLLEGYDWALSKDDEKPLDPAVAILKAASCGELLAKSEVRRALIGLRLTVPQRKYLIHRLGLEHF